MSGLSEVSVLVGQRAAEIEKARDIFTGEIRDFTKAVVAGLRRVRSEPWATSMVRLDLPKDIETESKGSDLRDQFALARINLRFRKGTNFIIVATVNVGIEFDERTDAFIWCVTLVPHEKYLRVDDHLWHNWQRTRSPESSLPGAEHRIKENMVRFLARPLNREITLELAFNDVKTVLEFLMSSEIPLAEAVGKDLSSADEA
jgi:hypothetical protein